MKKTHTTVVSPSLKKFIECFYCIETFQSAKERKAHTDVAHKQDAKRLRTFMCSICGKIFTSLDYLRRHMGCVHEDQEYFCDICDNDRPIRGKVRLYEHMRYRHLRKHNQAKVMHTCHICGQSFSHSSSKRLHIMRNHMDKTLLPYQCKFCSTPRGFATRQAYMAHYRTHTGEKNFICPYCGLKFGTRNHLKQHQSVHEIKDLMCNICCKHFTSERYLKQHLKIHERAGYVCPMCPAKSFSLTTTLRGHIKTNHPDFPLPPPNTVLKNYDWTKVSFDQ